MLVVDASLAVELSLDRVGAQARESLGDDLVAPPLLWSEAASVLNELAYRHEVTRELADRAFGRFVNGEVGITERRTDGLLAAAWRLAKDFGWAKIYDAEYIALAQSLECRLVTLDMRLRRGADRLGLVVTPDEL